jgi:hypothetical protein
MGCHSPGRRSAGGFFRGADKWCSMQDIVVILQPDLGAKGHVSMSLAITNETRKSLVN